MVMVRWDVVGVGLEECGAPQDNTRPIRIKSVEHDAGWDKVTQKKKKKYPRLTRP